MSVSDENKTIAKTALAAFGGKPLVHAYWDDNKKIQLTCSLAMIDHMMV